MDEQFQLSETTLMDSRIEFCDVSYTAVPLHTLIRLFDAICRQCWMSLKRSICPRLPQSWSTKYAASTNNLTGQVAWALWTARIGSGPNARSIFKVNLKKAAKKDRRWFTRAHAIQICTFGTFILRCQVQCYLSLLLINTVTDASISQEPAAI